MIEWINVNKRKIFSSWLKVMIAILSLVFGASSFFPESVKNSIWLRILVLISIGLISFCTSILSVYRSKMCIFWHKGAGSIKACYDDLFKIAANKTEKYRYVVIPVNTAFDTIIDKPSADKPLVSSNTLHGRWLEKCQKFGLTIENINQQIKTSLEKENFTKEYTRKQRSRGNLKEYPIGTIIPVTGDNNVIFLLAALSQFDENNNAQSSIENLRIVIEQIINYCDKQGQGYPVFLPVMGTGLSRANLGKNEAFQLIKYLLLSEATKIHEEISIVIYPNDKNQISIFS